MLRLVNVNSNYGLVHVLKNVSLHVGKGEVVTIIGANGAGKTTTLRAISGLQPVAEGQIYLDGKDITGIAAQKLVAMGVAHVPEGRQIFAPMSVHDNLELGGLQVYRRFGRKQLKCEIESMFERFEVLRDRQNQYAGTLSGGEQQMLALAMALMSRPRLLLLDEPSMGLAPLIVKEIFRIIEELQSENGLTVLLIEQNANAALKISDRGYVLETGRIVLEADAEKLLSNPEVKRAYLGREQREIWE
ncbi:MAG: ABC transporter ATP-binding protein [Deltaproteobacteria bacterium]|nr:ABC transporter ATP-binding protein [Deltaproteobacteria bacterium]